MFSDLKSVCINQTQDVHNSGVCEEQVWRPELKVAEIKKKCKSFTLAQYFQKNGKAHHNMLIEGANITINPFSVW